MKNRNAKLNLTSKVARATVFALLFVLVLSVCLVTAFDVDSTNNNVAFASKDGSASSTTYGSVSTLTTGFKTNLKDIGSNFAYSWYVYTYIVSSGTGMTNNSTADTVSVKLVQDGSGEYANFVYRKRYNFTGTVLELVQGGFFSSVTISATATGGNKGVDYGITASTITSGSYSSVAAEKNNTIKIGTTKTAALSTSTKGIEIDFQGTDSNDPTLTFKDVVLTFTRNPNFSFTAATVSGANFALRNRSDFVCLATDVSMGYNDYSNVTFSVEPNTANSQTAYASGGREIKMLSTEFTPIGNSTYQFKGSIKGNGCTISGLKLATGGYSGLFGKLGSGASVENLTISDANGSGGTSSSRGILAGSAEGTVSITNCHVSGSISGTIQIAGLVGYVNGATLTITNCTNNATVTGSGYTTESNGNMRSCIGGLVGYANASATVTITNSSNKSGGTITGQRGVGGLVGYAYGTLTISGKYSSESYTNSATVNGGVDVGGIVGYMSKGSVSDTSNNGTINGKSGADYNSYSIVQYDAHAYSDQTVANINDGNTNTKYYSENKASMSFVVQVPAGTVVSGFAITNANDTSDQTDRAPVRVFIFGSNTNTIGTSNVTTGGGVEYGTMSGNANWTEIYNSNNIGIGTANFYRKDIQFSNIYSYTYYLVYVSHGTHGSGKLQFSEFDLLYSENVGGIVGRVDAAEDNRASISGASNGGSGAVSGGTNVGGIVGYDKYGNINTSASNAGAITGYANVGGIFGRNNSTGSKGINLTATGDNQIINTGAITSAGGNYIGGIGGYTQDAIFSGAIVNTGTISASGKSHVGGIGGYFFGSRRYFNESNVEVGTFTNSGNVSGGTYTGGIAGLSEYGTIGTSYNSGRIEGGNYTGGIVGQVTDKTTVSNTSMRNTAVVKGSNYVGGIFGDWKLKEAGNLGTFESYGTVAGTSYVGGIFGNLNTNGKTLSGTFKVSYEYDNTNYAQTYVSDGTTVTNNHEIVSHSGSFGGGLFGYTSGGSTITFNNGTQVSGEIDAYEGNIAGGRATGVAVGGAVGANIDVTLNFANCTSIPIYSNIIGRSSQTVSINGTDYANAGMIGGVVGFNGGTLTGRDGVYIIQTGSVFNVVNGYYVGGIVGYNTGTVTNCRSNVSNLGGDGWRANYTGGVIGYNTSANVSGVYANSNIKGYSYIGGYFGYTSAAFTFSNIEHSGTIEAWGSYAGGFVGQATANVTFSGCTNSGEIVGTGNRVGGFVGEATSVTFSGTNLNTANITGGSYSSSSGRSNGDYTGGFVGKGTIDVAAGANLRAVGVVKAFGNYAGGLFGEWTLKEGRAVGTLEFYGTVAGKGYVGGIAGKFDTANKALTGKFKVGTTYDSVNRTSNGSGEIVAHIEAFAGGVFGYASGGSTVTFVNGTSISGQLDAWESKITGNNEASGNVVGGAVGANVGVTLDFSACTTTPPITSNIIARRSANVSINGTTYETVGMIGGVVGFNSGTIKGNASNYLINAGNSNIFNTVASAKYTGGVVGYNTGSLTNCRAAAIVGYSNTGYRQSYTGGIAGYNSGTVSGVYTNSTVYGVGYTGGYFGYTTAGVSNVYHTATITASGQYVGGIAGNASGATFANCYHKGTITGGTNVGGIVGGGTPTLQNCYVEVDDSNLLTGTTVGGLSGETGGTFTNSWAIYYGSNAYSKCTVNAGKAVRIEDDFKSTAKVYPNNGNNWNVIASNSVTYFYIANLSVVNGSYLGLFKMTNAVTPTSSNIEYNKPNYIVSTANADGSVAFNSVQYMGSTASSIQVKNCTINDATANIGGQNGTNNFTYNGDHKLNKTNYTLLTGVKYNKATFTLTSGDDVNVSSAGYKFKIVISYDSTGNESTANNDVENPVLGQKLNVQGQAITAFDLSAADAIYCYNGPAYGMEKAPNGNDGYNITKFATQGVGVLEYASDYTTKFYIYSAYFGKIVYNASSNANYTTVTMTPPTVSLTDGVLTDRIQKDKSISFSGTANYANSKVLYYTLVDSDFGVRANKTRDNTWGSEDNPFVISNWIYLVRLSDIVNGTMQPIDSVVGYSKATGVSSKATTIFYDGCYFEVSADIEIPAGIIFNPIGGRVVNNVTSYNQGITSATSPTGTKVSYFGGNFVGANGIRNINIGNHFNYTTNAPDFVGLFGYIDVLKANTGKAGVKNIAVSGTIKGTDYVGGIVGYAKNAVIDSAYVSASSTATCTVGGDDYVGSIAGYLGAGCELYTTNVADGTVSSQYVTVQGTNYVGGFIGAIEQTAGYDAGGNTYVVGGNGNKVLKLVGNGTITATGDYVGGIVGAIKSNSSTSITKFAPNFARNTANISARNYVGGIVGAVLGSNVISLENAENSNANTWSYNGTSTGSTVSTVGGTDYVGGIAGYLDGGNNLFTRVFSTANVNGGSYVGGLVGQVKGGTFNSCFVTEPGTNVVAFSTDKVVASTQYAGGIAGSADGANVSFNDCYVQGFKWSRVSTSSGGVAGYASSTVKFENSWALYLAINADYTTVSKNGNGKYIIADPEVESDNNSAVQTATIDEMLVFAGLQANTTLTGSSNMRAVKTASQAGKGIIPLGITLPTHSGALTNDTDKVQLVFYDVSGTETATDNAFNAENDSSSNATMLYIYLAIGKESMSVCRRQVVFNNVSDYTSATAWQNAYLSLTKPIQYRENQYKATVSLTNTAGPYEGAFQISFIANYTVSGGTLSGTYVYVSRNTSFSYSKNSSVAPLIIANMTDWNNFANTVRGTQGTWTGAVKLTANIGTASNPVTLPAGYCSTTDINKFRFGGTFDGNGYTITVNLTNSNQGTTNEISLFPQAAGATFMNLTVAGSVGVVTTDSNGNPTADASAAGSDIGAFVGIARGNLTFLNCKNQAFVSGGMGHNTGGLVGTAGNNNVTFIDCVNEGSVISAGNFSSNGTVQFGVGGIIGSTGTSTTGSVILESCRNSGPIASDANVGGIIGLSASTCTIRNCGNTGNVTGASAYESDTCVGGIAGIGTQDGNLNIYACYNTGDILAYGNKAGGILGGDSQYTTVGSKETKIYYCYNTGSVTTGGPSPKTSGGGGVQAAGIVGTLTYIDIQYCYNVGTIRANGVVYTGSVAGVNVLPHARIGGIGGYAGDNAKIVLKNCYNVGLIVIGGNIRTATGDYNDSSYAAGILGEIEDSFVNNSNVSIDNNYSLKYQVHRLYKLKDGGGTAPSTADGGLQSGWDSYEWQSYAQDIGNCSYSGNILPSIADFTSVYYDGTNERIVPLTQNREYNKLIANDAANVTVKFGPTGGASVMNTKGTKTYGGATTVTATNVNTGIENGTLGGYVFIYGCLPQLACFALDTKNGLAMTSMGYGYDEVNERYVLQPAGGEENPYVVKDGIDFMGINAITQPSSGFYDFNGTHIEFADSTNNLSGDICTYINLPTQTSDIANAYKFTNGKDNKKTAGKSYHIYSEGAVVKQQKNYFETSVNSYSGSGQWKARNAAYSSDSALSTGAEIYTVNIYPVGMFGNSNNRSFKGNIDGRLKTINANNIHQTVWDNSSKAEVRGLKLDRTIGHSADVYAGLFAFIENATVSNIKASGSITGRSISSGGNVHVGIVGYAKGESTIDGLEAVGLTIQALNGTGGSRTNAVGGIIGVAEPASEQTLTIKNCKVSGATTVTGFAPNIGGIIGLSSSYNNAGASAQVVVQNCNVQSATLSTTGTKTLVGGIVGKCSDNGSLTVTGSSVGTIGNLTTSDSNYSVTIKGDYAIGGIAGNAVANANSNMAFIDCTVYGDVVIERTGTTNDSTYGTAIGGIVGYISNDANAFSLFRGALGFHGTINASVGSATVKNIGGAVGYMGTSAVFDSIDVNIYGKIVTPNAGTTENIGGFAGYNAGGTLDGEFFVAPVLDCENANYVGGFIGLNGGNTAITRTSEIYTAKENGTSGNPVENGGGSILGKNYVGGFIGGNSASGDSGLYIGAKEFLGASFGSDGDKANIILYSSVDGKAYIGGFLGRNEGNLYGEYCQVVNAGQVGAGNSSKGTSSTYVEIIGGVIGSNGATSTIVFGANASFQNNGQVGNSAYTTAYQKFIGGILGANAGTFNNTGILVNTGNVYGYEYVGGAIGLLISGTISGTLSNGVSSSGESFAADSDAFACDENAATTGSATVTAEKNVGGVIGAMLGGATIGSSSASTHLYNYGTVTATNAISNAGGIIGLMYGTIQGSSANKVVFENHGQVVANNFAGGIIGVVDGLIDNASFSNYSAQMEFGGNTAMGGAIGAITTGYGNTHFPSSTVTSVGTNYNTNNIATHITNTHFAYQASEGSTDQVTVTANGSKDGEQTIGSTYFKGGLGGVIGVINASDISDTNYWSGNSYYVNGNVKGTGVDGVGGLVGAIDGSKVVIENMLVYQSAIEGANNVGGIVGYNASGVTSAPSIINCFNVKGTIAGTSNYGGIVGNAVNTYTDGSYWILPFSNDVLNKVDPNNISGTLNASFNVAGSGKSGYKTALTAVTTTNTDTTTTNGETTKIVTTTTTTGGQLFTSNSGATLTGAADMNTTLYYATVKVVTTSTLDTTNDEWTTTEATTTTYTAVGTPKDILNFSVSYMSANSGEPSALGYASWEALATAYNPDILYNPAHGFGSYGDAGNIVYSTGDIEHGFFYVYAQDGATGANATISVDITGNELAQWNIIANTPVKGTIDNSAMTYDNSAIEVGHIYTKATVPNGSGYYVYFYGTTPNPSDNNAESDYSALDVRGKSSSGQTGTIYFDWDTNAKESSTSNYGAVGNVLVYFRKVTMESGLVYNGMQRYAPIVDMTYKLDTASSSTDSINQSYYYFAGTTDGSVNTATNAGTYDVKANIWFRDSAGEVITIGSVDSTVNNEYKWTINQRELELTDKTSTSVGIYDNTYKHYVEFVVENSVYDGTELLKLLSIKAEGATVSTLNNSMPTLGQNSTTAYYTESNGESSTAENDCSYTVVGGAYSEASSVQTYTYTFRVYFNQAGSHKVEVSANTNDNIGKNYKLGTNTLTVQVNRRKLTISTTYSGSAPYTYNGGASYQGLTRITIGGSNENEGFVGTDYNSVKFTVSGTATVGSSQKNNLIAISDLNRQGSSIYYNVMATDAATYNVTITKPSTASGVAKNYTISGSSSFSWTIAKYDIETSGLTIKDTTVTYDGKAHYIDSEGGSGTGSSNQETLGKETITFRVNVTYSGTGGSSFAVNVGTYTASISADSQGSTGGTGTVVRENGCLSKVPVENAADNYNITFKGTTTGTATLTINQAEIKVTAWNVGSYVYTGSNQGPSVTKVNVGGTDCTSIAYSNNQVTISNVFGSETLTLTATGFRNKDAGSYTAKVTAIASATGNNAAGATQVGNYKLVTDNSTAYTIAKSKISFTYTGTVGDKVYDGTTKYEGFNASSYSISTSNGGSTSNGAITLSDAHYWNGTSAVADTNVKTGTQAYSVRFNATLKDSANYEWTSGSGVYTTSATAHITPKGLTVTLNDYNNRAYKSFDNDENYATITSSGGKDAKSKSQRTGKGITVSGFITSDSGIVLDAFFREENRNRADFDEYVNGISKDANGNYSAGSSDKKMLEFKLSSTNNKHLNYYIADVEHKGGSSALATAITAASAPTQLYVLCKDSQITSTKINNVATYKSSTLSIEITKYTAKADYSNTTQSYAKADNSYNTDWVEVTGKLRVPSSWKLDVEVEVENGWMTENGQAKEYKKYTRIVGRASSANLGATLKSASGKDLCVNLRNQPTLVIGYFVATADGYQVGSVAGLLIATEYYKGNFKDETSTTEDKAYNFNVVPMAVPTGVELDTSTYPTTWEGFLEAYYTKYNVSYDITTHPAYATYQSVAAEYKTATGFDLEEPAYGIYIYEDNEETGYYYWQPIEIEMPTYTKFVQVNDFDMIVTDRDLQLLQESFGNNWGAGKTYLSNVVLFNVGSVAVLNNSVFAGDFNGTYDGAGYTINHLTILANVTSGDVANIGMFSHLGAPSTTTSSGEPTVNTSEITSINIRNANIQVYDSRTSGTLNVGGIVGYAQLAKSMTNCTFHGIINVNSAGATVNVGGLVGKDESSVENLTVGETTITNTPVYAGTVVATITVTASTANVGGIVGLAKAENTYQKVVSVSEIYVFSAGTVNMGGIVGTSATVTDGHYLKNATFTVNNGTYTAKTNAYGSAKTYDELYNGSNSNYNSSGVMGETATTKGALDFVADVQPLASASENATIAPRESMRLADVIDTYVLKYEISETTITIDGNSARAYQKAGTSAYVGTAKGTTSSRIGIANQQHVNLITAFNYMNFSLKNNITMYTGYTLKTSPEAFIGSVTRVNNAIINVRTAVDGKTPQMFAHNATNSSLDWYGIIR